MPAKRRKTAVANKSTNKNGRNESFNDDAPRSCAITVTPVKVDAIPEVPAERAPKPKVPACPHTSSGGCLLWFGIRIAQSAERSEIYCERCKAFDDITAAANGSTFLTGIAKSWVVFPLRPSAATLLPTA